MRIWSKFKPFSRYFCGFSQSANFQQQLIPNLLRQLRRIFIYKYKYFIIVSLSFNVMGYDIDGEMSAREKSVSSSLLKICFDGKEIFQFEVSI